MKVFSFFFFIASICGVFSENEKGIKARSETILVLLEKDVSEALLEAKDSYYIFNPYDGSRISSGLLGKRFMIRSITNGIKWGEEFPGIHQLSIVPRSPESSILVNGIQYDGEILVIKVGDKLHIVNKLPIESYIKSILSLQFPVPLENEVMASIAIAARTTAYAQISKNKTTFWHIAAHDVGYQGLAVINPESPISHAVDATKNLILVHSQNEQNIPFPAYWTEHSAGKTASFQAIFRKESQGPKTGVEAAHASLDRQESKWTYSLSKKQLSHLFNLKNITSVELFLDSFSKKAYAVRLKNGKENLDIDFFKFQASLGKEHILSNDFQVLLKKDTIVFTGYGKGHGVGICLHSAAAMAQNGDNAVKILSKFFPNTFLTNLGAIPDKEIAKNTK